VRAKPNRTAKLVNPDRSVRRSRLAADAAIQLRVRAGQRTQGVCRGYAQFWRESLRLLLASKPVEALEA
jgi:hypothetical protein